MSQIEIRPSVLRAELAKTLQEIQTELDEVNKYASNLNIPVYTLRDANGGWVYIPLLAAKAQCLAALAQLQSK